MVTSSIPRSINHALRQQGTYSTSSILRSADVILTMVDRAFNSYICFTCRGGKTETRKKKCKQKMVKRKSGKRKKLKKIINVASATEPNSGRSLQRAGISDWFKRVVISKVEATLLSAP